MTRTDPWAEEARKFWACTQYFRQDHAKKVRLANTIVSGGSTFSHWLAQNFYARDVIDIANQTYFSLARSRGVRNSTRVLGWRYDIATFDS